MKSTVDVLKGEIKGFVGGLKEETTEKVDAIYEEMEDMRTNITVLERAVASGGPPSLAKVKVKEPNSYKGRRDAKELENYLWQMEQDFRASKIDDEEVKVSTAAMYLTDDAMLLWRRQFCHASPR